MLTAVVSSTPQQKADWRGVNEALMLTEMLAASRRGGIGEGGHAAA